MSEYRDIWEEEDAQLTEIIESIERGECCFEFAYGPGKGQMKSLSNYQRVIAAKGIKAAMTRQRTKIRKLFLQEK